MAKNINSIACIGIGYRKEDTLVIGSLRANVFFDQSLKMLKIISKKFPGIFVTVISLS